MVGTVLHLLLKVPKHEHVYNSCCSSNPSAFGFELSVLQGSDSSSSCMLICCCRVVDLMSVYSVASLVGHLPSLFRLKHIEKLSVLIKAHVLAKTSHLHLERDLSSTR